MMATFVVCQLEAGTSNARFRGGYGPGVRLPRRSHLGKFRAAPDGTPPERAVRRERLLRFPYVIISQKKLTGMKGMEGYFYHLSVVNNGRYIIHYRAAVFKLRIAEITINQLPIR